MKSFNGFRIEINELVTSRSWIFPKERFFEWEPKDEWFCKKYGIGHAGPVEPACYQVGNTLVMHPTIYKELVKYCERIS
jgi:hypothetical protein